MSDPGSGQRTPRTASAFTARIRRKGWGGDAALVRLLRGRLSAVAGRSARRLSRAPSQACALRAAGDRPPTSHVAPSGIQHRTMSRRRQRVAAGCRLAPNERFLGERSCRRGPRPDAKGPVGPDAWNHAVASAPPPLCSSSIKASVRTHRGARGVAFGGGPPPSYPRGGGLSRDDRRDSPRMKSRSFRAPVRECSAPDPVTHRARI
jgi:hypothetical protein